MKNVTSSTIALLTIMISACAIEDVPERGVGEESARVEMVPWSGTPSPAIAQVLRDHPGGVHINTDQIAWNDGTVVLTIPSEPPSLADNGIGPTGSVQGCPVGWYCFYQNINFNAGAAGRRLQFSDCNSTQFLTDYGFGNQTSSWVVNKTVRNIVVFDALGTVQLWTEFGHSNSSWVGPAANDRADWFNCSL